MWDFAPGPPVQSMIQATARFNLWHGPIRSGKTSHSVMAFLAWVASTAPYGGELFMVGKTVDTLERNILKPAEEGVPGFRYNKGQGKAWFGGREISLLGAADAKAESRIRGVTGAGFYFDELTLLPWDFVNQARGRMSLEGARAYATTNPDGPYHRAKVELIDRADDLGPERFKHFTWPIDTNPFLPASYIADIKAEYQPGTLWYKRFIEGLWVAAEGAVFDFFDESVHRLTDDPGEADFIDFACDYGTSNATAVGAFGSWRVPLESGLQAYLKRLYYHSGRDSGRTKTDSDYADAIDDYFSDLKPLHRYFIVDPSAASFKAELSRRGWRIMDADNDVLNGIRTHAKMLKAGRFKLGADDSVLPAVREYGGYLWDAKAQARGEDRPIKENDHVMDCIRYFCQTLHADGVRTDINRLRKSQGFR